MRRLAVVAVVLACGAPAAASASLEDLVARCRGIEDAAARLRCYDTAAGRPAAAGVAPAGPAEAALTAAGPTERTFGFTAAQIHPTDAEGPKAIHGRIASIGAGRIGGFTVTLDSGQVWASADDGTRLNIGDEVTVKRAALGSFLLVAPDRHTYRVSRSR